jgi:hypothetical protein
MIVCPVWFRSSYCITGTCVEVAFAGIALVRDSKHGDTGPVLRFSLDAWQEFVAAVRTGLVRPDART